MATSQPGGVEILLNTTGITVCPDDGSCRPGTCDPANGGCTSMAGPAGTPCGDADLCTTDDTCTDGQCVGLPVTCTPSDQCHLAGSCDPAHGCSSPLKEDGSSCDDVDVCTKTDSCRNGVCTGADPIICRPLDQCHVAGACDPLLGCSNPEAPEAAPCDDANACTRSEGCYGGVCGSAAAYRIPAGTPVPLPGAPRSVATGDFDENGVMDIVETDSGGTAGVLLGDGHGGFRRIQSGSIGSEVNSVAVGDFDRDGHLDLITADRSDYFLRILAGDGTGRLVQGAHPLISGVHYVTDIVAADFNGDARLDLAVALDSSDALRILLGDGAGGFTPAADQPVLDRGTAAVVAGDLNGDGTIDLVAADYYAQTITALLGDGLGGFTPAPGSPQFVPNRPYAMAIGDFDLDHDLDLALALDSRDDEAPGLILLGEGDGRFHEAPGPAVEAFPQGPMHVVDLDFDGRPDLVGPMRSPGGVGLFLGDAAGHFQAWAGSPLPINTYVRAVAVGQFDEDPQPDLAVTLDADHQLKILLGNAGVVACPGANSCTTAACDPATGACSAAGNVADGTPCSDGDRCTTNDVCRSGACIGVSENACPAPDQCHLSGLCDPATGGCSNPMAPDGTSCSDGNSCTVDDACRQGVCAGVPRPCVATDGCHLPGTCNPATGACSNPLAPDATPCEDGNLCSVGDTCRAGLCEPSFIFEEPGTSLRVGPHPSSLAVRDVDADGTSDLVMTNLLSASVTVLLGSGGGSFHEAHAGAIPTGAEPVATALADFNLDGTIDLAVANSGSSNVTVLLGAGHGAFSEAVGSPVTVGPRPSAIVTGRFNNDSLVDLAVADESASSIIFLVATSPGRFSRAGFVSTYGTAPTSLVATDFNGDGRTDLAVANRDSGSVTILLQNAQGVFQRATGSPIRVGDYPTALLLADVNRDGLADLAVVNALSGSVTILDGHGGGLFTENLSSPVSLPFSPTSIATADVNLDGYPDLIAAGANGTVGILPGFGGTFTSIAARLPDGAPAGNFFALFTDDFNRDRKPDLAIAELDGDRFHVLLNGTGLVVCTAESSCEIPGACEPSTGTCFPPRAAPDGTVCDDGSPCTGNDICRAGSCIGDTLPNGEPCNDLNSCTTADRCSGGDCVGTVVADRSPCNDRDPCTADDRCASGICAGEPLPEGSPCNDRNPCTVSDACTSGTCRGIATLPDGAPCDDLNLCTSSAACLGGTCVGEGEVVCVPTDGCHVAGRCDPATGACTFPQSANGAACADHDDCAFLGACSAGVCTGLDGASDGRPCSDGNPCTEQDACIGGRCQGTASAPDGEVCDDGNACTQSDACRDARCVGADSVLCGPDDECHTAGICDPGPGSCSSPSVTMLEVGPVEIRGGVMTTIQWPPQREGALYDVARGRLSDMIGDRGPRQADCFAFGSATTSVIDDQAVPSSGDGFYYLVRWRSPCGVGTYGWSTTRQERQSSACQ